MVTWLSRFCAWNCKSALRRSPMRKMRPSDPFRENVVGPGMVFRPALPQSPESGAENAAVLNSNPEASTGRPASWARNVLLTASALTWKRLPPTVAVNGFPERTLTLPLMVQSFIRAPFQPFTSVPPLWPMPVLYWNCRLRLCRASKLERPRSAARSNQFCATGVLRSEEHTSELQSLRHLVCRLLLGKKNMNTDSPNPPCAHAAGGRCRSTARTF